MQKKLSTPPQTQNLRPTPTAQLPWNFKKLLSLLLYLLPTLFFIACYYLMVTSGEDIFQGANTAPDIIQDALAAFRHSARLSDMFAWSIINFYTYTTTLGPDFLFRTIDVLAALSVFYLATYLILRRRPHLKLSDALTFSSLFLLTILSTHGRIFYCGFSGIHNYVFLSLTFLLFLVPTCQSLWHKPTNKSAQNPTPNKQAPVQQTSAFSINWTNPFLVFVLSFLFAFSSNVTSIVFLFSLIIYFLIKHKKPTNLLPTLSGIFLALLLIYIVGDGLSDYSADPTYLQTYDYLSFSALFANLPAGILKVIQHNLWNTARLFATPIILALPLLAYAKINHYKFPPLSQNSKNFLLAGTIFVFTFILCFSQLAFPTRLALPAYLAIIILEVYLLRKLFLFNRKKLHPHLILASLFLITELTVLAIRTSFALDYLSRIKPMLNQIQTSSQSEICFNQKDTLSKDLPYFHLGQESFLVDWAIPQTIYGKQVYYCPE